MHSTEDEIDRRVEEAQGCMGCLHGMLIVLLTGAVIGAVLWWLSG